MNESCIMSRTAGTSPSTAVRTTRHTSYLSSETELFKRRSPRNTRCFNFYPLLCERHTVQCFRSTHQIMSRTARTWNALVTSSLNWESKSEAQWFRTTLEVLDSTKTILNVILIVWLKTGIYTLCQIVLLSVLISQFCHKKKRLEKFNF